MLKGALIMLLGTALVVSFGDGMERAERGGRNCIVNLSSNGAKKGGIYEIQ
jgi:hypothetical protein